MKCEQCRNNFTPTCVNQRFCSKTCSKNARRKRKHYLDYQQRVAARHADNLKIIDAVINRLEAIT